MQRLLTIFCALAAVSGATGCSSSSSPPPPTSGCQPADVSFAKDVIPVFQMNCTTTNVCHGQMGYAQSESLYLGTQMGTPDPATIISQIVGVKAKENPSMDLVAAGSTANSFLWHKLQTMSDLQALGGQCSKATMTCLDCNTTAPCGDVMPYLADALSVTDPDSVCKITNWIQNGAKNN
jgi:hypothetical protein